MSPRFESSVGGFAVSWLDWEGVSKWPRATQHRLSTHGQLPPPREWGVLRTANVRCEADHVRFEGLRFELGVGNGILVRRGQNIAVRDCAFVGIRNQPTAALIITLRKTLAAGR